MSVRWNCLKHQRMWEIIITKELHVVVQLYKFSLFSSSKTCSECQLYSFQYCCYEMDAKMPRLWLYSVISLFVQLSDTDKRNSAVFIRTWSCSQQISDENFASRDSWRTNFRSSLSESWTFYSGLILQISAVLCPYFNKENNAKHIFESHISFNTF